VFLKRVRGTCRLWLLGLAVSCCGLLGVSGDGSGLPPVIIFPGRGGPGEPPAPSPKPVNDDFSGRIQLSGTPAFGEGTNLGATWEDGEPDVNSGWVRNTVWWS
jgi:hypothetical protein